MTNLPSLLLAKIDQGLAYFSNSVSRMKRLSSDYQSMPPQEQSLVRRYFAWMFTFGMYNRYWKGPGTEWPKQFHFSFDKCTQDQRDLISQISGVAFLDEFINPSAKYKFGDGTLQDWIINLPRIRYEWLTGYASLATFTGDTNVRVSQRNDLIYTAILRTLDQELCESELSDVTVQSSFVYLTKVIGLSLGELNKLINEYLQEESDRFNIKNGKQLTKITQEPFNPTDFSATEHEIPEITNVEFD
jgi:hypothetical protein